jgi:hypothetical protein
MFRLAADRKTSGTASAVADAVNASSETDGVTGVIAVEAGAVEAAAAVVVVADAKAAGVRVDLQAR